MKEKTTFGIKIEGSAQVTEDEWRTKVRIVTFDRTTPWGEIQEYLDKNPSISDYKIVRIMHKD